MFISRDARRVINTLLSVSGKDKPSINDLWTAEQLVYTYYPNVIIGHIKRYYNPKSKNDPSSMKFYEKPARSQGHGKRTNKTWVTDDKFNIWSMLSKYVISDYSYDDLAMIKEIDVEEQDIEHGIKVGRENRIYSIAYAIRIAERNKAEREKRRQEIRNRRNLFHKGDNNDINSRSKLEVVGFVADWKDELENLELQKKIDDLWGR